MVNISVCASVRVPHKISLRGRGRFRLPIGLRLGLVFG